MCVSDVQGREKEDSVIVATAAGEGLWQAWAETQDPVYKHAGVKTEAQTCTVVDVTFMSIITFPKPKILPFRC